MNNRFVIILTILLSMNFIHAQSPEESAEQMLLLNGKYLELIDRLENKEPKADVDFYYLGLAYQSVRKPVDALNSFNTAIEMQPENVDYLTAAARINNELDLIYDAAELYRKIIKADSTNFNAMLNLGSLYIKQRFFDRAEKLFLSLKEVDPENGYFYEQLGIIYSKEERVDEAINCLTYSVRLNELNAGACLMLAQLYLKKEQPDSSMKYVDIGLKNYPNDGKLNKLKGELRFQQKEYFSAVNHFVKAVSFGEPNALVYQKMGLSYYFIANSEVFTKRDGWEQKLNEAITTLKLAYDLDPQNALTCFYLGVAYKQLEDFDTAREYFDLCLENIYPSYLSDVYAQIGSLEETKGNYSETIKAYQKAYEINPGKKNLLFHLAAVYDRFYADREVPLIYFQKFLSEQNDSDEKLVNYAESRVDRLIEERHFGQN